MEVDEDKILAENISEEMNSSNDFIGIYIKRYPCCNICESLLKEYFQHIHQIHENNEIKDIEDFSKHEEDLIKDEKLLVPLPDSKENQNDDLFNCFICDESFKLKEPLNDHLTKEHFSVIQLINYHCRTCDKNFDNNDDLSNHHVEKCLPNNHEYQCKNCEKCFSSHDTVLKHVLTTHQDDNVKKFQCDEWRKFLS